MRYLVTGGSGFFDSNMVEELLRRGHNVIVLDDLSTGKEEKFAGVRDRIELLNGTVTDSAILKRARCGADYLLHLAARTSVPRSVQDRAETNRINVDGTLNVLLAARDAGIRRVVFAGSSFVYGDTPALPRQGTMQPAPIYPYGISKFVGELYRRVFHRVFGLEFVPLRYFNAFGLRQDPSSQYSGVLSLFISAMLEGDRPIVHGDGEQSRDFTFVADAVEANLLAFEAPGVSGMAFNIGTGGRYTLNQNLRLLEKYADHPAHANYVAPRAGDIRDSQADISLVRYMLGYNPRVGFEEGLRRTWDWYRKAAGQQRQVLAKGVGHF